MPFNNQLHWRVIKGDICVHLALPIKLDSCLVLRTISFPTATNGLVYRWEY